MSAYFKEDKKSFYLDQSAQDSPCRVRFSGGETLISLSKWGGEATLLFGTGSEHQGRLEVCRNEILLKPEATAKTHHVFRKLDGERFEYDVILLKEPETNMIELGLDFPEGLEFYRQPSLEDVLAGRARCAPEVIDSYAVYWKNRNGSYKTGKFCHIYRPLIFDARGRKVWGRLLLTGKKFIITIPEDWLSEASYPVVVDPVVGTQTRGASNQVDWYGEGFQTFFLELKTGLNRFTAASEIAGTCTSYLYSYMNDSSARAQAALFSNSGTIPLSRLSRNETVVNLARATPAWVPSTFTLSRNIAPGETFWYGYNTPEYFYTYLDYINTFKMMWSDSYTGVPDTFEDDGDTYSILMSMYFSYTDIQHYVRTLLDTIGLTETLAKRYTFRRSCAEATNVTESKNTTRGMNRICTSVAGITEDLTFFQVLIRYCESGLEALGTTARSIGQYRLVASACGLVETLLERMLLKKEELIFVSRVTREIEFKGYLL